MTRRDWWIGIGLVVVALLLHAALPRYEWENRGNGGWARVDRWTGDLRLAGVQNGEWWEQDISEIRETQARQREAASEETPRQSGTYSEADIDPKPPEEVRSFADDLAAVKAQGSTTK